MCDWPAYGTCNGCSFPFYIMYHNKFKPWRWNGCGKNICLKHVSLEPTACGALVHCKFAIGDRLGRGQAVNPSNLASECGKSYKSNCKRNFYLWIFCMVVAAYSVADHLGYFKTEENKKHLNTMKLSGRK